MGIGPHCRKFTTVGPYPSSPRWSMARSQTCPEYVPNGLLGDPDLANDFRHAFRIAIESLLAGMSRKTAIPARSPPGRENPQGAPAICGDITRLTTAAARANANHPLRVPSLEISSLTISGGRNLAHSVEFSRNTFADIGSYLSKSDQHQSEWIPFHDRPARKRFSPRDSRKKASIFGLCQFPAD